MELLYEGALRLSVDREGPNSSPSFCNFNSDVDGEVIREDSWEISAASLNDCCLGG